MLFGICIGGVFRQPHEGDLSNTAVAVFQQNSLCQIGVFHIVLILALAVKADNNIGILLNGAGFTQVGKHGALILTALVGAAELA